MKKKFGKIFSGLIKAWILLAVVMSIAPISSAFADNQTDMVDTCQ